MERQPVMRKPEEGRTVAVVGDVYRFLATGADTDGRYAMWEALVTPGGGPPPHLHTREEESFLVLDGEISFLIGENWQVAAAGTFVNMPVGCVHCFKNNTDRPVKLIISVAPAGLDDYFFEVGTPLEPGQQPAPPNAEEIQRLLAAAPRYGLEIRLPAV